MLTQKLSFVPKYHDQIKSGKAAGKWTLRPLGRLSREAMAESLKEARTIVAQGHVLLVFDMNPIMNQISPGDTTDADRTQRIMRESRKINLVVVPQLRAAPYYLRFNKSKF